MAESNQGHGVAADYERLQRKRPFCPAPNPGATRQKSLEYGAANLTDQKNVSIWRRAHRKCLESAGRFKKTLESFWKSHLSIAFKAEPVSCSTRLPIGAKDYT